MVTLATRADILHHGKTLHERTHDDTTHHVTDMILLQDCLPPYPAWESIGAGAQRHFGFRETSAT